MPRLRIRKIARAPLSPGASHCQNAERSQNQQNPSPSQSFHAVGQSTRSSCGRSWIDEIRRVGRSEAQQVPGPPFAATRTMPDEITEFGQPGKGEVTDQHRRDGNAETVGRIERRAGSIVEQGGLNPELDGRAKGRHVDARISRDSRRNNPTPGTDRAPRHRRRYTAYATSEPTIAMLKQFAPIAVIPPSPKKTAWIINATEMATMDAHGPSTMLATPMPTACPVVPPGSGRLNIMMTKENAAKTERRGIIRVFSIRFTRRRAIKPEGRRGAKQARASGRTQVAVGDVHSR